jgi:hypothetical protein
MKYIKNHYTLASNPEGIPDRGKNVNFEVVMAELKDYIAKKRNRTTFLQLLDKYQAKKKIDGSDLYKRAWIDRRHFFKIVNDRLYHPTKNTVIALGIGLELNQEEMDTLLNSCGFALTTFSIVDITIMFCIERKIYNIYDINALLIEMKQNVLVKE